MNSHIFVYIDLENSPTLVGHLWARIRNGKESATFEYDRTWLNNPQSFSLEAALSLDSGPYHTPIGKALFGAIGDSAPDRWGRMLMRRAERLRAKKEKRLPRTLNEVDYLLMVDDETRLGALRFTEQEGGPFLAAIGKSRIPPLVDLPQLLSATYHIDNDGGSEEDLRVLLAPGSSLGGARPKASIRDQACACPRYARLGHPSRHRALGNGTNMWCSRTTASAALCTVIALERAIPPIMAFRRHVYFFRISSATLRMLQKFCGYLGLARSPCYAPLRIGFPARCERWYLSHCKISA